MKNIKCDICSQVASKTVYSYKNEYYRRLCNKHANEIVKNMKENGWNIEAKDLNEKW